MPSTRVHHFPIWKGVDVSLSQNTEDPLAALPNLERSRRFWIPGDKPKSEKTLRKTFHIQDDPGHATKFILPNDFTHNFGLAASAATSGSRLIDKPKITHE
jgi:hypothetical protein